MAEVNRAAALTLYTTIDSCYTGANIPGKKRSFLPYLGGWSNYLDTCDHVAPQGYRGFALSAIGGQRRHAQWRE
jgi:hypothetical protein